MPYLAGVRQRVSWRAPSNSKRQAENAWMVSGYFSGSTSTSAIASGVTQPAHTFTRGKTAASRSSGRKPARASLHAAVLPPGPPPTTITSWAGTSASHHREGDPQPVQGRDANVLDRVREPHGREQVALDVDGALDVGLGEIERRGIAHQTHEGLRAMQDDRARRRAAPEPHRRSVPETERDPTLEVTEEAPEHRHRARGADGRQHHRDQRPPAR